MGLGWDEGNVGEEGSRSDSRGARIGKSLFASLHYRDNRVFWIGTTLSSIAQASFLVAASWLAYRQGGGSATGIVTFAVMFPFLLATPVGGLLADRLDRRSIVVVSEVVQGIVALLLGVLAVVDKLPLPLLIALVFVSSIARTVELPTVGAVLPNLVPREHLLNTFSLNSLATLGSRFVGPALLAPILATAGAWLAFLLISLLYLPALWWVRLAPQMPRTDVEVVSLRRQIIEGGQFIRRHALIGLMLGIVVLHCWLTMSFDSTLPLIAEDNLNGSGAIYSSLVAGGGIGAIVGSLILAGLRKPSHRGILLLAGGIASGLTTAMMGASSIWLLSLVAMAGMGLSQAIFMTLATTLVQEATPDAIRGRVTGIFLMSAGGIMSFGNLGNGYLAEHYGAGPILGFPAIIFVALLLVISGMRPALKRVYRVGSLPSAQAVLPPVHSA
jgi:MFS family permease